MQMGFQVFVEGMTRALRLLAYCCYQGSGPFSSSSSSVRAVTTKREEALPFTKCDYRPFSSVKEVVVVMMMMMAEDTGR